MESSSEVRVMEMKGISTIAAGTGALGDRRQMAKVVERRRNFSGTVVSGN